jgi:hypothetical protein
MANEVISSGCERALGTEKRLLEAVLIHKQRAGLVPVSSWLLRSQYVALVAGGNVVPS